MYGNKKNICLLIVLIILVNIMPNIKYTANATGDLVFSNPIFTREADGESEMDVKVLKSGVNMFSLDVNNLGAPTAITLILSLYKNNSLEKTVLSTRTINSTYTLQSGIIVPETNGEKYILKAFVLDNMQSLMPLSATYFIETGDGE